MYPLNRKRIHFVDNGVSEIAMSLIVKCDVYERAMGVAWVGCEREREGVFVDDGGRERFVFPFFSACVLSEKARAVRRDIE